jgi:hypothetical protein
MRAFGTPRRVGEDLRKRRLVPLADRLRAGDQRHAAVGLETDVDVLVRRAAGGLDVIGEAQAAQFAARSLSLRRAANPATSACASA